MVKRRWPSSPLARSRGRASHEDCCAAARDPTGVGRAGFEPPSQAEPSQPELYGTRSCRGAERGPLVPGSPRHRRVSDERARIQALGTEREEEGERGGGRNGERKRKWRGRETERLPPPPLSGLPRVRLSVAPSDQEDGPTGGRLSGPSTRGASTGRPTTTTTKTKTSLAARDTVVC